MRDAARVYFTRNVVSGDFIAIKHGETGYYSTTVYDQDHADELNRRNGVTAEECEQAMMLARLGSTPATGPFTVRLGEGA